MSKGVNKAVLLGHVGKDPEIRSINGRNIVASFSLATDDRQKAARETGRTGRSGTIS
jgi:single-strand DNA-binding protein